MRLSMLFAPVLAVCCTGFALAEEDAAFSLTEPRSRVVAQIARRAASLLEATIEPTKHELRFDNVFAAEKWEQNFQLAARLPVSEALSLRQEVRSGIQNETVLGDEFTTAFRDAITMLEKTSAELRAAAALQLAASVQEQWLANNSVPFAEIVTFGAEAKFTPRKTTTVKLQLESMERAEFVGKQAAQETYRLALEQELVPKLKATTGFARVHSSEELTPANESRTDKLDGALQWSPLAATSFTLGVESSERETATLREETEAYAVKVQQQVFARSKLELQAGYELHSRAPLDAAPISGSGWNVGANSDFALHEDWNAGLGVRYRLRDDAPPTASPDELSLTLSVKGKF